MKAALLTFLLPLACPASEDNAVPPPVTVERFTDLLERPPFRRVLALTDALTLSGVASLPDGKMVTVWNRDTRESFIVTDQPNAQGWKLTDLTGSADLKSVAAVISSGNQSITVRFDPERLTPPKLDNTSRPARRGESQVVVEALLRALDPEAAGAFNGLPAAAQETFRISFAEFLGSYPSASDPERLDFVRKTLATIPEDPEAEAAAPSIPPAEAAPAPPPDIPSPDP